MGWIKRIVIVLVVLLMLLSVAVISFSDKKIPLNLLSSPERQSPSNWIKEEQIKVFNDRVILEIPGATWAKFTDTNSMDPFIDEEANAIELKPEDADSINIGDVISYETAYGVLIHRVIEKGVDSSGMYYYVKGDNNTLRDPFKVRFEDVKGVVVAVVY
ncbi:MAG: hypothetical protein KKH52_03440 [Nanoarchaeota archaeon]|nr:hypothetical protein [Nanoarchaeota archaeon]MBU1622832.1 hypothetical protein [Nanoarchaeota archaeon]MBU1974421.1 hypothetical protein [Nanoarchaeota archaeon]